MTSGMARVRWLSVAEYRLLGCLFGCSAWHWCLVGIDITVSIIE